jgi:hypothetical protein
LEFNIRKTELESKITELVKENSILKVDLIKSNDKFTARNKLVERMITQQSSKVRILSIGQQEFAFSLVFSLATASQGKEKCGCFD